MKEIFIISGQRKTTVFSIFAAAALVLTVSACTLTGIEPDGTEPLSGSELTYFKGLTHNFHCASAPSDCRQKRVFTREREHPF